MQITEHVHAIKIPFQLTVSPTMKLDRFVYVYLIYGKEICLIDSGVASSESVILDYISRTGRNPDEISMIVQTHSHPDHIGATRSVKEVSNCLVAAHKNARSWIEDVELQFRERPVPGFHSLVGGSVKVDRILEDGDALDLDDGLRLEVIHTPGHSGDSISLLLPEDRVLFSGDAIPLTGSMPVYEDALALAESIGKLRSVEGIKFLLASWDDPREGDQAYQVMDESLGYLKHVHEVVAKIAADEPSLELMELCRQVIEALGLPGIAANPLVARSISANLRIK